MRIVKKVFSKSESATNAPFVILNKDTEVVEYDCIEVAIAELEKDPDIPKHKIEKIRASFEELKKKGKIKIKNGEIIK